MVKLNTNWHHESYSDALINESISDVLDRGRILSLSTVTDEDGVCVPHSAICAFAYTDDLHFFVLTPPTTEHSRNVAKNSAVSAAIFDSHQDPQDKKQGLQINGTCTLAEENDLIGAMKTFKERFQWMGESVRWHSDWREDTVVSWLYVITPTRIKIFDEKRFGDEKIVVLELGGK